MVLHNNFLEHQISITFFAQLKLFKWFEICLEIGFPQFMWTVMNHNHRNNGADQERMGRTHRQSMRILQKEHLSLQNREKWKVNS